MKPKYILFLYLSLLLGFCTTEFFIYNFWITYIISAILYFTFICFIDLWFIRLGFPIISTTKRKQTHKREVGGDIARTIAVMLVPFVHFFGLTFYYNTEFNSNMIFPTMLRWLGVCAVPLFMLISGYFKSNAQICKKHFLGIIPLIMTHIFISTIRIFVDYYFHNIEVNLEYILNKLLFFEYGWYIRLYIVMLLLMPFFNIAYKELKSKRNKEIFILILIGLNSLGPLTFNVVPSSWLILYVFGYYLIGCYINEYKINLNPFIGIFSLCFLLVFISFSTYYHCYGTVFDWNFIAYQQNSGYSSMAVVFISTIIMVLCINIKFKNKYLCFIFRSISVVSLEMYLFSQLFDGFIYKEIIKNNIPFIDTFKNIFFLVGSCLVLSFIASYIKKLIFAIPQLIKKLFAYLRLLIKKHNKKTRKIKQKKFRK